MINIEKATLAPPYCPQSVWRKNIFNENPHTLSLFYPSCYQNGRRSLKEGHFIQLSLSSHWRRQGGRKETEWEGGRKVVTACAFVHICARDGDKERGKNPLCIFAPIFSFKQIRLTGSKLKMSPRLLKYNTYIILHYIKLYCVINKKWILFRISNLKWHD